MPGEIFQDLVWWALKSLPDEILVGLDIDFNQQQNQQVDELFNSTQQVEGLFQGQGYLINEAHIVNRGDSILFIIYLRTGQMTYLLHLEAQEQVDLPTGFTLTRMLQQYLAEQMQMRLKKHQVLI